MSIFLLILKILGIIIFCILAIAIIVLLILLFAPIKYHLIGNKKDNLEIDAKITWLFSIISVQYTRKNDEDNFKIKIPFINNKKEKTKAKKEKTLKKEEKVYKDREVPVSVHHITNSESDVEAYEESKKVKFKICDFFKSLKDKINSFIKRIKKLISDIIKYKNMAEEFDIEFGINRVLDITFDMVKSFLKAMKLKTFNINGVIGFDDPSNTGVTIGAIAMIEPFVPGKVNIEGDFNNSVISGDIKLKGRTNLLFIAIPVIKYILTEPIWSIIKKYWR